MNEHDEVANIVADKMEEFIRNKFTVNKFTVNKLTAVEIVKALECCCVSECDECPYDEQTACVEILKEGALALINRQKAEIELLQKKKQLNETEIERLSDRNYKCIYLSDNETTEFCVDSICPKFKTEEMIKAEAIKEFAERLKDKADVVSSRRRWDLYEIEECEIDDLVKEMVGETDGQADK